MINCFDTYLCNITDITLSFIHYGIKNIVPTCFFLLECHHFIHIFKQLLLFTLVLIHWFQFKLTNISLYISLIKKKNKKTKNKYTYI